MELGKKIKDLRRKAGLTQEQLAAKLSVAPQSVSKWENAAAMPDITTLPLLAEIFGVSIDELFDLTVEQRLNRIENRMDVEEELPRDVFREFEEFLGGVIGDGKYKKRATELTAYLYWHRMNSYAAKASRYAKEAVRLAPGEKGWQWILMRSAGHAAWDWNMSNHSAAIEFYRELADENPGARLPLMYMIDNLLADGRADEAEAALSRLSGTDASPAQIQVYRAHIALARFDETTADRIIGELVESGSDDSVCLFEAAQYHAKKCDWAQAIELYERSFSSEKRYPRYQDELCAIAQIYEITGEYRKAAQTWDRIIDLLENEWGMTEDTELTHAKAEKARLLAKA